METRCPLDAPVGLEYNGGLRDGVTLTRFRGPYHKPALVGACGAGNCFWQLEPVWRSGVVITRKNRTEVAAIPAVPTGFQGGK